MPLDSEILTALSQQLAVEENKIFVKLLERKVLVDDATQNYLVFINNHKPAKAFVIVSPKKSPGAVRSGYEKLSEFANNIGETLAKKILMPIEIGECNGLTYSISRYYRPLHKARIVRQLDQFVVKKGLIDWVIGVAKVTQNVASEEEKEEKFTNLLLALAVAPELPQTHKRLALEAAQAIKANTWQPILVSAHNDLWCGNLLRNNDTVFSIIDWNGAMLKGYAFYDLIRVATSFNLSKLTFGYAMKNYCEALQCDKTHAKYYLISAWAYLYSDLGDWQYDRFLYSVDFSMRYLESHI